MSMRPLLFFVVLVFGCRASLFAAEERGGVFAFHREHILGTSLEVQVAAADEETARAAEQAVVTEIERLSKVFSSYDPESELRRWQGRPDQVVKISPELLEMLRSCERWTALSRGAFHPGVEGLSRLWREAAQTGTVPTCESIENELRNLRQPQWRLEEDDSVGAGTATWLGRGALSFNAIAKGWIVDRACERGGRQAGVSGVLVSIGGDMRVCGSIEREVRIVDPAADAENARPLRSVRLTTGGLATSGNYRRGFRVGDRWYSHILDPRTGEPAEGIAGATVMTGTAADADTLATICSVLSPAESLELIERLPGARCLLVRRDGSVIESSRWRDGGARDGGAGSEVRSSELAFTAADGPAAAQAGGEGRPVAERPVGRELLELVVQFELAKSEGYDYHRPYVAVWLEDEEGKPVRTGLLFLETKQPGPQWHRELIRWYRNDQARRKTDETDLIGTISGATRGPGEYKVVFDGLDDRGKVLKPGKYVLLLEVSREHGEYQLIRAPLALGVEPIGVTKLKGGVEISAASYEYRAAKKPEAK